jgi:hypothetical protein
MRIRSRNHKRLCLERQRRNARANCLGVLGFVRLSVEKPFAFDAPKQRVGALGIVF